MRTLALLLATLLALAGAFVGALPASAQSAPPSPAPLLQRDENVVTADALPTVQINDGYVWAQTTIGTTVYAVGQFTNVRPAGAAVGTQLTPRSNVLAYNITTGQLIGSFAPAVNGVVKSIAASADGSRIYLGGSFSTVNGQDRHSIAALDAKTGALVPGFAPSIGGSGVYALTVLGDTVYAGGLFTQANGVARQNLAAFDAGTGALRAWAPATDLQVDAMVAADGGAKVVIGGRFYQVNSAVQRGLAALDPASGAVLAWQVPSVVKNGMSSGAGAGKAGIFGLSADATGVYGTGWVYADVATGNLEGVFAAEAATGAVRWIADCHGDHYGVFSTGTTVYTTSHTHQCETVGLWNEQTPRTFRYAEAYTAAARGVLTRSSSVSNIYQDWSGTPSPAPYNWFPDFTVGTTSGLGQAGLSVTGAAGFISVGGEFGSVNNQLVQGLTRFAVTPAGGAKQGPRIPSANWTPTASSPLPGTARISVGANWDRDDTTLTYELRRAGSAAVVASASVASSWWNLPQVALMDETAPAGSQQTYTVTVKDAAGNAVTSAPVQVSIAGGAPEPYTQAVLRDGASLFYRLGGDTQDLGGANPPLYASGVTTVSPGAIVGSATDQAASAFNGNQNGLVATTNATTVPNAYSTELWFKTTTNRGGKLIGYGNYRVAISTRYDRHLYMTNAGKLIVGNHSGVVQTLTSPASYNDGAWHHAVASNGADGTRLYVDGQLVASGPYSGGEAFTGYWRIGGDNLDGWPTPPSSTSFAGSIDDVAVYPSALSAAQVQQHYATGRALTPPTAAFTAAATDLAATFDASGSAATQGATLASYAWDFGDGGTGSGPTAAHTYASGGTFSVTLTVVDDRGLASTTTQQVTVRPPNVPPTAAFTLAPTGLKLAVDAAGSSDPDGTLTGYAWDWGDGTPAGSGAQASHTYAAAGDYTVTLTVTDDRGATAQRSLVASVSHADPTASFVATAQARTVTVDASASAGADGATLQYAWNWGDGTPPGSGATASHTYAAAGTRTVTLTVTDSLGARATATRTVTLEDVAYAAADRFDRTVASGWGNADVGGPWTAVSGAASAGSVDGATGRLTLPAGATRSMVLADTSLGDTESRVTFSLDAAPGTGASYVGVVARRTGGGEDLMRVWLRTDGTAWLVAQRGGTVLTSQPVSGLTWQAGTKLNLAVSVQGGGPATLKAKLWKDGTAEPTAWQLTATDASASAAGQVGLHFARSASATGPATASFDDFTVAGVAVAPPNTPPKAAFTATTTGLTAAVDAAGSTDAQGPLAGYAWDFGDGGTATGATASHTYAAAGSYQVKLTVTDAGGLTDATTKTVVVTAGAGGGFLAADDFERTTTAGWGSADQGGAWTQGQGSAGTASVSGGVGRFGLAAGQTRNALLAATAQEATLSVSATLDQAPSTGASYVGIIARQVGSESYVVRAWLRADGAVWLVTQRDGATLDAVAVPGLTWTAGGVLKLTVQTTGATSTTLRAKAWTGATEPTGWQITSTDSTPALQAPGTVGLHAARSASATSSGGFSFDTFRVSAA